MAENGGPVKGEEGACSRMTPAQLEASKKAANMRGTAFNFAVIIFIPRTRSGAIGRCPANDTTWVSFFVTEGQFNAFTSLSQTIPFAGQVHLNFAAKIQGNEFFAANKACTTSCKNNRLGAESWGRSVLGEIAVKSNSRNQKKWTNPHLWPV
jgi:hypothetical protein